MYKYNSGSTSWIQVGQDIYGERYNDYSGYSVSVSSFGKIVAIGAPYAYGPSGKRGVFVILVQHIIK